MIGVFRITEEDISGLPPDQFTDLMNMALRAEARSAGIPQPNVHTNLRVTDPDGGIDAQVSPCSHVKSDFIPEGESVWQYKSGDIRPSAIKKEMEKPGVCAALARGATYCLVIGRGMTVEMRNRRRKAIEEKLQQLGANPNNYRLYCADKVATWWSETPAIWLHRAIRRPVGNLLSLKEALDALPGSHIDFVADDHRRKCIEDIRSFLGPLGNEQVRRVEGPTGMGKTRLVLEALRLPDVEPSVVYARSPEDVPPGFFRYVKSQGVRSLVLIVDECEWRQAQRLADQMRICDSRCRLITIGPTRNMPPTTVPPTGVYLLQRLPDEDLRCILQAFEQPALAPPAIEMLVRFCGGVVKLAVLLGQELQRQPELQSYGLAYTYSFDNLLQDLFPERDVRLVMGAISLAKYVGWQGEVADEGRHLVKFVGVPEQRASQILADMRRKGYIANKGRYVYVTPDILAVWFAVQIWQERAGEMLPLYDNLPGDRLRQSFLNRLADLGEEPSTKGFCERFFRSEGFFSDLKSLDDPSKAKMFSTLALRMPSEGIRALRRILGSASLDELKEFRSGRREIVWLLEKLAWLKETFEGAARLLFLLGKAENENYANNASGAWAGLFSTYLGGTEVPALERHHLIEEALGDESTAGRRLAVKALHSVFLQRGMRFFGGEVQGGRIVPPEWQPRTLDDLKKVYKSGLRLLQVALKDEDEGVRSSARELMAGEVVRALTNAGMFDELADSIEEQDWSRVPERRELRDSLHLIKSQKGEQLEAEQLERLDKLLEELAGRSFGERLRRWAGQGSFADWEEAEKNGGRAQRQAMEELVSDALRDPDILRAELDWLFSDAAVNGWRFARELGVADEQNLWLDEFLDRAKTGRGQTIAAAYLDGCAKRKGEMWLHDFLDELAESEAALARVVFIASQSGSQKERSARRILRLVDAGALPAEQLGQLCIGAWTSDLPAEIVAALLDRLAGADTSTATGNGLALLLQYLRHNPGARDPLSHVAWKLLENPHAFSRQQMDAYYWAKVAEIYLRTDPIRVVRAVLSARRFEGFPVHASDRRLAVFAEASRNCPEQAWEEVSKALLADRQAGEWNLWFALRGWYASSIRDDILLKWAEENRPDGPRIVAALAPVGGRSLTPLVRELIIRYHEDEHVLGAIVSTHSTGTFTGSTADWLEGKAADAEAWAKDDDPAVREWARQLAEGYRQAAAQHRVVEEEEDLLL